MYQISLEGRSAIITGASRGIGREIALAYAEAGANVVVAARSADQLDETVRRCKAAAPEAHVLAVPTDVLSDDALAHLVDRSVEEFGTVDILVNNAGMQDLKPLMKSSRDDFSMMMNLNVLSAASLTRLVGERMIEQESGVVINMSSVYAIIGAPGNTMYCATKAALLQFGRALATEWARYGIRVNSICPGWVDTELIADYVQDPAVVERAQKTIPMRRFASPGEIAPLAVYLGSDASSYVTGQYFLIDGGQSTK